MYDKRNTFFKYFTACTVLLSVLVLADRYLNGWGFRDMVRVAFARPAVYGFEKLSGVRRLYEAAVNFHNLVEDNLRLKDENQRLVVEHATIDAVKEENNFLRQAQNLKIYDSKRVPVTANIYIISRSAAGYQVMLNRGLRDGISSQQAVITEQGVLVGVTQEVFQSTARLLLVSDPSFSATAQVFKAETAGIARGNGSAGLLLELIVKGDDISLQDIIVTSGDDILPPGLILGNVDQVDDRPEQVFKKVSIKPAAAEFLVGPVLVITRE